MRTCFFLRIARQVVAPEKRCYSNATPSLSYLVSTNTRKAILGTSTAAEIYFASRVLSQTTWLRTA